MPEEKDSPSGFKVVDRRPFSPEGKPREAAREEEQKPASRPAAPSSTPSEAEQEPISEDYSPEGAAGFETLVSYLSTTAMFQLGLLPGPAGERIPTDLPNARRTVDLLEVLQEKTQGNLTPDEARLLDDILYELRLSFVEMEKRLHQKKQ